MSSLATTVDYSFWYTVVLTLGLLAVPAILGVAIFCTKKKK